MVYVKSYSYSMHLLCNLLIGREVVTGEDGRAVVLKHCITRVPFGYTSITDSDLRYITVRK